MTVLSFERYPVDPSKSDEFESLVADLLVEMRSAEGILWADVAQAFDDEPSYVLLGEWRTEADLEAWMATGNSSGFEEVVVALLRGETTRRRYTG